MTDNKLHVAQTSTLDPTATFTLFHDVQHIEHHRLHIFGLSIPDGNRLYHKLLPFIRAALHAAGNFKRTSSKPA